MYHTVRIYLNTRFVFSKKTKRTGGLNFFLFYHIFEFCELVRRSERSGTKGAAISSSYQIIKIHSYSFYSFCT